MPQAVRNVSNGWKDTVMRHASRLLQEGLSRSRWIGVSGVVPGPASLMGDSRGALCRIGRVAGTDGHEPVERSWMRSIWCIRPCRTATMPTSPDFRTFQMAINSKFSRHTAPRDVL
jgi:hypothetical protein